MASPSQKFSTSRARQVQESLVSRMIEKDDLKGPIKTVCGLDVAYLHQTAIGAAVLLSFPQLEVLEQKIVYSHVTVPYIPTFLSFREFSPLSLAYASLQNQSDICFVDAHGRAHPRKLGAASHFGILKDIPTIGVAKRLLCGEINSTSHPYETITLDDEVIGARINSKSGCNPIYVSVGHRISLETAVKMTLQCVTKYRLPEPTRHAHRLATKARLELKQKEKMA
ncbi:MAG: deoxyribonuclease V [Candidatus Hermodarchaeota archaeon]|nr:deoxyribonuclease V [Candidatus Hermodarchaeota archaeon]